MSKNKQNKQPSKFWNGTKEVLSTLVNNDRCVEMKDKPWWAAIIVALMSVAIAVAPYSYFGWKAQGAAILNEPTYGIKEGLIAFDEDVAAKATSKGLTMDMDAEAKTLTVANWDAAYPDGYFGYKATYNEETVVTTTDSASSTSTTYANTPVTKYRLAVFFYPLEGADFVSKYTEILGGIDQNGSSTYSVSTLFLGTKGFFLVKNPTAAKSYTAAMAGTYDNFAKNFSFKDLAKQDLNGNAYSYNSETKTQETNDSYVASSVATWSDLFNRSYANAVKKNGWVATGIAWAIDVTLVFLMGLMLFLMTRGKSNPYRIYTFWQTQKMAYWASLAPALLALIIGFIWNNSYALFFFMFIYGLRLMWMSMHSLSPNYQASK
jgi:hypothetical protein